MKCMQVGSITFGPSNGYGGEVQMLAAARLSQAEADTAAQRANTVFGTCSVELTLGGESFTLTGLPPFDARLLLMAARQVNGCEAALAGSEYRTDEKLVEGWL